ncbi:MAG: hypothetical protein QXP36_12805 [Conexivisphaerales archaeon]
MALYEELNTEEQKRIALFNMGIFYRGMDQAFESILSPEFEIGLNSKMRSLDEVYAKFGHLIRPGMLALRVTASLCPECVVENKFDRMKIPALVC